MGAPKQKVDSRLRSSPRMLLSFGCTGRRIPSCGLQVVTDCGSSIKHEFKSGNCNSRTNGHKFYNEQMAARIYFTHKGNNKAHKMNRRNKKSKTTMPPTKRNSSTCTSEERDAGFPRNPGDPYFNMLEIEPSIILATLRYTMNPPEAVAEPEEQ